MRINCKGQCLESREEEAVIKIVVLLLGLPCTLLILVVNFFINILVSYNSLT